MYQAAEYVIRPLIRLLCGGSTLVRKEALNLLIELVGAAAYSDPRDEGVVARCRERAREGLGVLYWLGRVLESQGKNPEALPLYEQAAALDIRFLDVRDRVKRLGEQRS